MNHAIMKYFWIWNILEIGELILNEQLIGFNCLRLLAFKDFFRKIIFKSPDLYKYIRLELYDGSLLVSIIQAPKNCVRIWQCRTISGHI